MYQGHVDSLEDDVLRVALFELLDQAFVNILVLPLLVRLVLALEPVLEDLPAPWRRSPAHEAVEGDKLVHWKPLIRN